jgi:hypothetical protein
MATAQPPFHESKWQATPIRDLKLTIAGTWLEPIVAEFQGELERAGIRRLRPQFYLTTEWGVPFDTIAIGIPYYLARPEMIALHTEQTGFVEGATREDILRYLRHEMGHVVNYGYRLYDQEEWVKHFGAITQPYEEEYRPDPFSRRYVWHLPGWYAQKHPDEDWAETFAVWMTPGEDWRVAYADWPVALAKLAYCDRTLKELADRKPLVNAVDLDEDVADLTYSIDHFYHSLATGASEALPGLDGPLRTIFEEGRQAERKQPAGTLIRRLEHELLASVYRWTGHFPERTRVLVRYLADRADQLQLFYPEDRETPAVMAVTTLVTALAMNHVHHGTYLPASDPAPKSGKPAS